MKVLIADSHEVVRAGLRQMLRRCDIVEAETAEAALRLFRKHKPDLTILEVRIPGDGLDCLARIKRENPNARVLVFSGHENPTYIARAVALGAKAFCKRQRRPRKSSPRSRRSRRAGTSGHGRC